MATTDLAENDIVANLRDDAEMYRNSRDDSTNFLLLKAAAEIERLRECLRVSSDLFDRYGTAMANVGRDGAARVMWRQSEHNRAALKGDA